MECWQKNLELNGEELIVAGIWPSAKPKSKPLQKSISNRKYVVQKGFARGQWTEELMQTTIQSIKLGQRSIRNASKFFSIPARLLGIGCQEDKD